MCWRRSVVVLLVLLLSACRARISGSDGATSVTILKCCPNGQVLGINNFCKPAPSVLGHSWLPPIYNPLIGRLLEEPPKYWRIVEGTKPKCSRNCVATTTWSHISSPVFILLNNGSLLYEFKKYFNPESFCVDSLVAVICMEDSQCQDYEAAQQVPSEITVKKSRVKKCCGEGAVFSESKGHCIALPDSNDVAPNNLTLANFSSLPIDRKTVNFSLGFPVCLEGGQDLAVAGKLEEGESLKEDGSLYVPGVQITLKAEEFCIEHLLERPTDRASIFTCAEYLPSKSTPTIVREAEWDIRYTLYPIGLFLSAFFLAATLAAGCLLPSSHHMLHWRCQTGHVACLLVGDVLLAVTQLAGEKVSGAACTTLAISMHFFFLAAFFWLNTMCFNIWWTFRDLRPASLDKGQEAFRLRLYQLYAWGGPMLIAGVAALIDNIPEDSHSSLLRPRFGQKRCWFYGDVEIFPYFYGPIGVLLVVNLVLFAATAHELTCGLWKREVVKSNTERATLGKVCLKLVVVMGLTWVVDVLSWAIGGPHYLWYATDLVNVLQGVFIFIVAGCQPQVWAAVNRLWCLRPQHAQRTNRGQHISLYSQGPPSLGDSVTNNHSTKTAQLETLC